MRRGAQQVWLRLAVGDDAADGGTADGVDRADAAFEPVGGGFDFAFVEEERAEVNGGLRIVWRNGQRFAEAALRFLHVAAGLLRVAEIVENFSSRRFFGCLC